ncbi:Polycystin-2 [Phytophthora nicotianae]|uniref:Polycystin-2 n=1 Tax=Phytophthora nicotianae TaxID=4792 RepID=A0A0W8DI84_PHYNI|nr:Polycystin-2 [Phytophthora nicotianae]
MPLFGEGLSLSVDSFKTDLASAEATNTLDQFVSDSATRVLQVHCLPARADEDSPMDGSTFRVRVNVGIEYSPGKKSGHDVVCFIKRFSAPLAKDQTLNHQLQVMTLGLGSKEVDKADSDTATSSSGENTEEEDEDRGNLLSVVYNYVHQSFTPLVNEYSKVHMPQSEMTNLSEGTRGLPAIRRRMKELELALLQYQQNIEIPEVNLIFHPVIQQAAELVREKGVLIEIPFNQFEQLVSSCKELFTNWHRQVTALYDLTKELFKRRGGSINTEKLPLLSELQMEHVAIEERLLELYEFREQHEKLRDVIQRVLGGSNAIGLDEAVEVMAQTTHWLKLTRRTPN